MRKQEEAAHYAAAHPEDAEAQAAAKKAAEEAAAALAALQALTGDKSWKDRKDKRDKKKGANGEKIAAIREADRIIDDLAAALAKNDADAVAHALQALTAVADQLPEAGLEKYIPNLVAYVADPTDTSSRTKCLEDIAAMQDALDLVASSSLSPKDRLVELVCRQVWPPPRCNTCI